jgi:hypothetical protein
VFQFSKYYIYTALIKISSSYLKYINLFALKNVLYTLKFRAAVNEISSEIFDLSGTNRNLADDFSDDDVYQATCISSMYLQYSKISIRNQGVSQKIKKFGNLMRLGISVSLRAKLKLLKSPDIVLLKTNKCIF